MRLGINLPTRQPDGQALTIDQVMRRAALIERVGFDGTAILQAPLRRPDALLARANHADEDLPEDVLRQIRALI